MPTDLVSQVLVYLAVWVAGSFAFGCLIGRCIYAMRED